MASSSGERTESDKDQEGQLLQISPDKGTGRKCMRGIAKSSKPPKVLKKKGEQESADILKQVPEEVA